MRPRSGFTLVEILVALVIMAVVSGAVYQMLIMSQRLTRAQTEQVSLQSNVRTGSMLVPTELRELNTVAGGGVDQNDVLVWEDDRIVYRAMRGLGTLCESPAANTQVRLLRETYSGFRDPQTTDSIYVFLEGGNPYQEEDDSWLPVRLTGAPAVGNVCPGPAPGIMLATDATPSLIGLPVGTPIRIYEVVELSLHVADGKSWLGARSLSKDGVGGPVQPVLGPLLDGTGFVLEYLDGTGTAVIDKRDIKSIRVTVRGLTDEAVRANGSGGWRHPQEELISQVLLRNSIRP